MGFRISRQRKQPIENCICHWSQPVAKTRFSAKGVFIILLIIVAVCGLFLFEFRGIILLLLGILATLALLSSFWRFARGHTVMCALQYGPLNALSAAINIMIAGP